MRRYLLKIKIIICLVAGLGWQIIWSSLKVMYWIMNPNIRLSPGVVHFPLQIKDPLAITLLSYAITLTPGTLTLDISEDRSVLYLHTLFDGHQEKLISEIKKHFEHPIMELWQ